MKIISQVGMGVTTPTKAAAVAVGVAVVGASVLGGVFLLSEFGPELKIK